MWRKTMEEDPEPSASHHFPSVGSRSCRAGRQIRLEPGNTQRTTNEAEILLTCESWVWVWQEELEWRGAADSAETDVDLQIRSALITFITLMSLMRFNEERHRDWSDAPGPGLLRPKVAQLLLLLFISPALHRHLCFCVASFPASTRFIWSSEESGHLHPTGLTDVQVIISNTLCTARSKPELLHEPLLNLQVPGSRSVDHNLTFNGQFDQNLFKTRV